MKTLFTTLLAFTAVVLSSFAVQNTIDGVISALKAGNASDLSRYFDDNVKLTLPDKEDTYSKAQAQLIVKDFFSNNKVKTFDVKHKGDQNGDEYCIGTLSTGQGSFRTTVFAKNKGGKQLVNEVRFQVIE
jgi:F420-dependent methylenetetrahydromethanopterin dehydrogenase